MELEEFLPFGKRSEVEPLVVAQFVVEPPVVVQYAAAVSREAVSRLSQYSGVPTELSSCLPRPGIARCHQAFRLPPSLLRDQPLHVDTESPELLPKLVEPVVTVGLHFLPVVGKPWTVPESPSPVVFPPVPVAFFPPASFSVWRQPVELIEKSNQQVCFPGSLIPL